MQTSMAEQDHWSEQPPRFSVQRRVEVRESLARSTVPVGGCRSVLSFAHNNVATMNPRIAGREIVDGETRLELDAIRSFERTDLTVAGWFYIHVVVLTAFWISSFEAVQWWMSAIGAVIFLLLAAFVIPLSTLTIHSEIGTKVFRGTTSRLHDITDVLSARFTSEGHRGTKGEQDGPANGSQPIRSG